MAEPTALRLSPTAVLVYDGVDYGNAPIQIGALTSRDNGDKELLLLRPDMQSRSHFVPASFTLAEAVQAVLEAEQLPFSSSYLTPLPPRRAELERDSWAYDAPGDLPASATIEELSQALLALHKPDAPIFIRLTLAVETPEGRTMTLHCRAGITCTSQVAVLAGGTGGVEILIE